MAPLWLPSETHQECTHNALHDPCDSGRPISFPAQVDATKAVGLQRIYTDTAADAVAALQWGAIHFSDWITEAIDQGCETGQGPGRCGSGPDARMGGLQALLNPFSIGRISVRIGAPCRSGDQKPGLSPLPWRSKRVLRFDHPGGHGTDRRRPAAPKFAARRRGPSESVANVLQTSALAAQEREAGEHRLSVKDFVVLEFLSETARQSPV